MSKETAGSSNAGPCFVECTILSVDKVAMVSSMNAFVLEVVKADL